LTLLQLNAAKEAYDNGGVAKAEANNDDGDDNGGGNGDIYVNDNESDEDYHEDDGPLSDGKSVKDSGADVSGDESDEEKCAFDVDYGNTKEISGPYVAVVMSELGLEVSVKEHKKMCGCNLKDKGAIHFLKSVNNYHGTEDVDKDAEDGDRNTNEEVAYHSDEGYEGGEDDD
jgi:hypothetical protein